MATHFPLNAALAAPSAAIDGNFDISGLEAFRPYIVFVFCFLMYLLHRDFLNSKCVKYFEFSF